MPNHAHPSALYSDISSRCPKHVAVADLEGIFVFWARSGCLLVKNVEAELSISKQKYFLTSIRSEEGRAPVVFLDSCDYLTQYTDSSAIAVTDVVPLDTP